MELLKHYTSGGLTCQKNSEAHYTLPGFLALLVHVSQPCAVLSKMRDTRVLQKPDKALKKIKSYLDSR